MLGIRHVALVVADLPAAERFWVDVMGYAVEWRPDPDNVYLCGGRDNLALHQADAPAGGRADSITSGIAVAGAGRRRRLGRPSGGARRRRSRRRRKTHRDGSRSLYFRGPEGLLIQIIHHAPLVG